MSPYADDDTSKVTQPWWKFLQKNQNNPASQIAPITNPANPWKSFGQAVGGLTGNALQAKKAQQAYNSSMNQPANPAGSMTNYPRPDPSTVEGQALSGLDTAGMDAGVGGMGGGLGIPMAQGRVVSRPTLALLGENEPEAVVPLSHRPDAKVRPNLAGGYRAR
jgi:hypothetical protein